MSSDSGTQSVVSGSGVPFPAHVDVVKTLSDAGYNSDAETKACFEQYAALAEPKSRALDRLFNQYAPKKVSKKAFVFFVSMWDKNKQGKQLVQLISEVACTQADVRNKLSKETVDLDRRLEKLAEIRKAWVNQDDFKKQMFYVVQALAALENKAKPRDRVKAPLMSAMLILDNVRGHLLGSAWHSPLQFYFTDLEELYKKLGDDNVNLSQFILTLAYGCAASYKPDAVLDRLATALIQAETKRPTGSVHDVRIHEKEQQDVVKHWLQAAGSDDNKRSLFGAFVRWKASEPAFGADAKNTQYTFKPGNIAIKAKSDATKESDVGRALVTPELMAAFLKGLVHCGKTGIEALVADEPCLQDPRYLVSVLLKQGACVVYSEDDYARAREVMSAAAYLLFSEDAAAGSYQLNQGYARGLSFVTFAHTAIRKLFEAIYHHYLPKAMSGAASATGLAGDHATSQLEDAMNKAYEHFVRFLPEEGASEFSSKRDRYAGYGVVVDGAVSAIPNKERVASIAGRAAGLVNGQYVEARAPIAKHQISPAFLAYLSSLLVLNPPHWWKMVLKDTRAFLKRVYPWHEDPAYDPEKLGIAGAALRKAGRARRNASKRCAWLRACSCRAWLNRTDVRAEFAVGSLGTGAVALLTYALHAEDFDKQALFWIIAAHVLPWFIVPAWKLTRWYEGNPRNLSKHSNKLVLAHLKESATHVDVDGKTVVNQIRYTWTSGFLHRYGVTNFMALVDLIMAAIVAYSMYDFKQGEIAKDHPASAGVAVSLYFLPALSIVVANATAYCKLRYKADWREKFTTELERRVASEMVSKREMPFKVAGALMVTGWHVGVTTWYVWNFMAEGRLDEAGLFGNGNFLLLCVLGVIATTIAGCGPKRIWRRCKRRCRRGPGDQEAGLRKHLLDDDAEVGTSVTMIRTGMLDKVSCTPQPLPVDHRDLAVGAAGPAGITKVSYHGGAGAPAGRAYEPPVVPGAAALGAGAPAGGYYDRGASASAVAGAGLHGLGVASGAGSGAASQSASAAGKKGRFAFLGLGSGPTWQEKREEAAAKVANEAAINRIAEKKFGVGAGQDDSHDSGLASWDPRWQAATAGSSRVSSDSNPFQQSDGGSEGWRKTYNPFG